MKRFEIIDISGDAGIRSYGESMEELFVNAAMGMYNLITDIGDIREKREITIDLKSQTMDGLLVAWLNELIFHFDTYGFLGKKIMITEITPSLTLPHRGGEMGGGEAYILKGTVSGEDFDPEIHEKRLLIKAATYHQLSIDKKDGFWVTNIIFDI